MQDAATIYTIGNKWSEIVDISHITKQTWSFKIPCPRNCRLNSGSACHSMRNNLSSSVLFKIINLKIYSDKISSFCCLGVKLLFSHWWRNISWYCSRIRCQGTYFDIRETRWQGNGEDCLMRHFKMYNSHQISFGWSKKEMVGSCGVFWKVQVHTGFSCGDLTEKCYLEDTHVNGRII
jgi:hypothetical protein